MTIWNLLSAFIGFLIGLVCMAILASGGRADEIDQNLYVQSVLRKVWIWWYSDGDPGEFPESEVREALK